MNKLLFNEENLLMVRSHVQEKLTEYGIGLSGRSDEVAEIKINVYDWFTWATIINSIVIMIKDLSPKNCLVGKVKYFSDYNPLFDGKYFRELTLNVGYNK